VRIIPTETFNNLSKDKKDRIINAAINEFAEQDFEHSKLSRIIKDSKIPRGSMYQYFEDKLDLYIYIFGIIRDEKLVYMRDLLPNPEVLPFVELFRELYKRGIKFALDNPKYASIGLNLFKSRGLAYEKLLKDNLELAKKFYVDYIETDKKLGRIDPNIDSGVFADLVLDMTSNIVLDELEINDLEVSTKKMMHRVDQIIYIFKKGITGEQNV
jgi:AcrR family transcriptional regulator